MVNYLHEIPVIIPTVHTSSVMSAIAHHLFHPSIQYMFNIRRSQRNSPGLIMGEIPAKNYSKNPRECNPNLYNVKFLEKPPGNSNGGNYSVEFPSG